MGKSNRLGFLAGLDRKPECTGAGLRRFYCTIKTAACTLSAVTYMILGKAFRDELRHTIKTAACTLSAVTYTILGKASRDELRHTIETAACTLSAVTYTILGKASRDELRHMISCLYPLSCNLHDTRKGLQR